MIQFFLRFLRTDASSSIILVRLIVGVVFLSEGVQKLIIPEVRGLGRFVKLGVFSPEFTAPFVGSVEIITGLAVLLGLGTRFAVIPLFTIMLFAIYYTQIPVFQEKGFWEMANKIRTDWSMTLGTVFLFLQGGGAWSLDAVITSRFLKPHTSSESA